jgi:hypothetical protein
MENAETPKLKEPKLEISAWKEQVKSTRQLVMGGRVFTHYFNEAGDCIATGLGAGPYHLELFIFKYIEEMEEFIAKKAVQDEAERAIVEANRAAKAAVLESQKSAGKKPFVKHT